MIKIFKRLATLAITSLCLLSISYAEEVKAQSIAPHPRLFLNKGAEKNVIEHLAKNKEMSQVHNALIRAAEEILPLPTLERIKEGKRLLPVSQDALRRIFFLSYAYRTSGELKYAKRAEREMLEISNFVDWNPSHFLDTAEMTAALAIGLDWIDGAIEGHSRQTITQAIIDKGLKESLDPKLQGIFTNKYNWNSVCNAGMALGALAVYENDTIIGYFTNATF